MTCLVVDVGNTSTALACVSNGKVRGSCAVKGGINDLPSVERALQTLLRQCSPEGVAIASVVPSVNRRWCKLLRQVTGVEPLMISHALRLSVAIDYPRPASIGADRLANACGAVSLYGAPVIVADFGTALTFDVVDANASYVGGVIAPGLPLMTDYLADRTALLPLINPKGPCGRVGRSTEGAMRIGARMGYRGMVREITEHLLSGMQACPVALCATGGFAGWVLQNSGMPYSVNPHLTLLGIHEIYRLNA